MLITLVIVVMAGNDDMSNIDNNGPLLPIIPTSSLLYHVTRTISLLLHETEEEPRLSEITVSSE